MKAKDTAPTETEVAEQPDEVQDAADATAREVTSLDGSEW